MRNPVKYLLIVSLVLLVACNESASSDESQSIIRIVDDEFSPKVINVPVGSTVIWESGGANNHNVIASDGSWQAISSDYFEYGIITKGDQYEYTFDEPGVYEYYCPYHGTNNKGMVGTVIVGDVEYSAPVEKVTVELSRDVLIVSKSQIVDGSSAYSKIQDAVDADKEGDLILIGEG